MFYQFKDIVQKLTKISLINRGENFIFFILLSFLEIYDGATLQESFLASPILLYAGKKGYEYGKPRQTTPLKLGVDLSSEQTPPRSLIAP